MWYYCWHSLGNQNERVEALEVRKPLPSLIMIWELALVQTSGSIWRIQMRMCVYTSFCNVKQRMKTCAKIKSTVTCPKPKPLQNFHENTYTRIPYKNNLRGGGNTCAQNQLGL